MDSQLVLDVTQEQKAAIQQLFTEKGWSLNSAHPGVTKPCGQQTLSSFGGGSPKSGKVQEPTHREEQKSTATFCNSKHNTKGNQRKLSQTFVRKADSSLAGSKQAHETQNSKQLIQAPSVSPTLTEKDAVKENSKLSGNNPIRYGVGQSFAGNFCALATESHNTLPTVKDKTTEAVAEAEGLGQEDCTVLNPNKEPDRHCITNLERKRKLLENVVATQPKQKKVENGRRRLVCTTTVATQAVSFNVKPHEHTDKSRDNFHDDKTKTSTHVPHNIVALTSSANVIPNTTIANDGRIKKKSTFRPSRVSTGSEVKILKSSATKHGKYIKRETVQEPPISMLSASKSIGKVPGGSTDKRQNSQGEVVKLLPEASYSAQSNVEASVTQQTQDKTTQDLDFFQKSSTTVKNKGGEISSGTSKTVRNIHMKTELMKANLYEVSKPVTAVGKVNKKLSTLKHASTKTEARLKLGNSDKPMAKFLSQKTRPEGNKAYTDTGTNKSANISSKESVTHALNNSEKPMKKVSSMARKLFKAENLEINSLGQSHKMLNSLHTTKVLTSRSREITVDDSLSKSVYQSNVPRKRVFQASKLCQTDCNSLRKNVAMKHKVRISKSKTFGKMLQSKAMKKLLKSNHSLKRMLPKSLNRSKEGVWLMKLKENKCSQKESENGNKPRSNQDSLLSESVLAQEKKVLELLPKDIASRVRNTLAVHRNWTDSKNKHYMTCPFCNRDLTQPSYFINHLRRHANNEYQCSSCGKDFSNLRNLRAHLEKFKGKKTSLNCDSCSFVAGNACLLRQHLTDVHSSSKIEEFQCHICPKRVDTTAKLNVHLNLVHSIHSGPFECKLCGKKSKWSTWLKKHMKEHENGQDLNQHVCKECDKVFKSERMLKSHIYFVHKERSIFCKDCGKSFPSKSKLKRHEAIHANGAQYMCSRCSYRTYKKGILTEHMKVHEHMNPTVSEENHEDKSDFGQIGLSKQTQNAETAPKALLEQPVTQLPPMALHGTQSTQGTSHHGSETMSSESALQNLFNNEAILQPTNDIAQVGSPFPSKSMFDLSAALQTLHPELQGTSLSSAFYASPSIEQVNESFADGDLDKQYPDQSDYDSQSNEDSSLLNIHKYAQGFEEFLKSGSYDMMGGGGGFDESHGQNAPVQNSNRSETVSNVYGSSNENNWNMYGMLSSDSPMNNSGKEGLSSFCQTFYPGYQNTQNNSQTYEMVNQNLPDINQMYTSPVKQQESSSRQLSTSKNHDSINNTGRQTAVSDITANEKYSLTNESHFPANQIPVSYSQPIISPNQNQNIAQTNQQTYLSTHNDASVPSHEDANTHSYTSQHYVSASNYYESQGQYNQASSHNNYYPVNQEDTSYYYQSYQGQNYSCASTDQYYSYDEAYNTYSSQSLTNQYQGDYTYSNYHQSYSSGYVYNNTPMNEYSPSNAYGASSDHKDKEYTATNASSSSQVYDVDMIPGQLQDNSGAIPSSQSYVTPVPSNTDSYMASKQYQDPSNPHLQPPYSYGTSGTATQPKPQPALLDPNRYGQSDFSQPQTHDSSATTTCTSHHPNASSVSLPASNNGQSYQGLSMEQGYIDGQPTVSYLDQMHKEL